MSRPGYAPRVTTAALDSVIAIMLALAAGSPSGEQGADVQITELECVDDPDVGGIQEVVVIKNLGDARPDTRRMGAPERST